MTRRESLPPLTSLLCYIMFSNFDLAHSRFHYSMKRMIAYTMRLVLSGSHDTSATVRKPTKSGEPKNDWLNFQLLKIWLVESPISKTPDWLNFQLLKIWLVDSPISKTPDWLNFQLLKIWLVDSPISKTPDWLNFQLLKIWFSLMFFWPLTLDLPQTHTHTDGNRFSFFFVRPSLQSREKVAEIIWNTHGSTQFFVLSPNIIFV